MDLVVASLAAVAATLFSLDLALSLRRRWRPHVAAYAVGIGMFAAATWALVAGLADGWSGFEYRVFFLLGGVLNIPYLALGSMFLVVGPRAGNVMNVLLGGFSAISVTLVSTTPFAAPLPDGGIPHEIFPPITAGFGPRLLAAIGGGTGTVLLVALALVSLFRFWRRNRRLVAGAGLIVAGTLAAATGGTNLATGDNESLVFSASLLVAATLLWLGYRVSSGTPRQVEPPPGPLVVLVGPSTESPERAHAELMIGALEAAGYRVMCPARDIEAWGDVGFPPTEVMRQTFAAVEEAAAVVVDLAHGYGTVTAGYARALEVPVVVAAPEGQRIPRPLRGVATLEAYYTACDDVARRLGELVPLSERPPAEPARRPQPA